MKKLRTTACLLVGTVVAIVSCIAPAVVGQEVKQLKRETRKAYMDFALQAPLVNTSPGREYASSTRMIQGVPGIERTAQGRLWAVWSSGEGPRNYVVLVTSKDDATNWSEPKLVIDPRENVRAGNPCLWSDPRGGCGCSGCKIMVAGTGEAVSGPSSAIIQILKIRNGPSQDDSPME